MEVSPALVWKLGKSTLMLEKKNALIAVIYGLSFSIKVQFLKVSCGAFLFRIVDDCSPKCPNSKETPLP